MGSKSDPPPAPDYKGAAEATANGNRVNQYTPYGNLTYTAPTSGNQSDPWSQHIDLSPVGQQLLDAQNQTSLGMSGLQNQGLQAVRGVFGHMPTSASLPQLPDAPVHPGQTGQQALMARLQPQLDRNRQALVSQLANQGIGLGSEAYKNAMSDQGQQENDAYSQAALHGIGLDTQARQSGLQERQQGIQEQNYYSTMPINLLNAVRTGSQVQNPTFGATPQGANYLGAAQMQGQGDMNAYNARIGQQNSFMSGLMGLGGAALIGSDSAIKQDVKRIGTHERGFGIYEFRYRPEYRETWGPGTYVGVLAHEVQEVLPHAIHRHPDGYAMVNYGAL
jgi:hypothetical protein